MNDQITTGLRETLPYWQEDATLQNFGDYLTQYLLERLFLRTPRQRREIRLIGSYLDDGIVALARDRQPEVDVGKRAALLAWGGGLRKPGSLSQCQRPYVEILSVRGPLSRRDLGLDPLFPIGDPGLLMPALYRPHIREDFVGRTLCVPHYNDARSVEDIIDATGADRVLRPNIHKSLGSIERFIDALTSAEFVLCGSLHAAIVAAAYGRPFSFWDSGAIDIPFKWADFAASINSPCAFQANLKDGQVFYHTEIRDVLKLPPLWGMLSVAPFPIRPDALISILNHEGKNSGSNFKDVCDAALTAFVDHRYAADAPIRDLESLLEEFSKVITNRVEMQTRVAEAADGIATQNHDSARLSAEILKIRTECDDLSITNARQKNELSLLVEQAAQLNQAASMNLDQLFLAYRHPFRPLSSAVTRLALKFALAFKSVLPPATAARFHRSLQKRKPSTILRNWHEQSQSINLNAPANSYARAKSPTIASPPQRLEHDGARTLMLFLAGQTIYFSSVENPEVTIIIPSYRDREWLLYCLRSLCACQSSSPTFEVIVIDDSPEHPTIGSIPDSPGLLKIQNDENIGFLRSCNKAVAHARGRALCFLNSDTIVTVGWLSSLLDALDTDADTGIVGGMLLNSDGTIQDAGWRILDNGWGQKIGENCNSNDGAYTYRRQVDCVTGACLAISFELWHQLAGFDDRYAPAFYEEFDLCFRAIERGYKVVYEPACKVFHVGSASYGPERRDELSGRNQRRFYERHADRLRQQPTALPMPTRWSGHIAGPKKRCILMIDDCAPDPTTHAGALTTYSYIQLFANLGWRVVFGSAYTGRHEGDSVKQLEKLGVAFIRQPKSLRQWIYENGEDIDQVLIARPEIADEFLGDLRAATKAKICYYTHDLHYLRMQRESELANDASARKQAKKMYHLEARVFDASDVVLTPSSEEADIIRSMTGTQTRVMPPYFFDPKDINPRTRESFETTKDIIFIGGFPHRPNVDAASFLVEEIMPIVWHSVPDANVLLVGYAPPKEVLALAGPRVTVTGQVPDLKPFCDRARFMLAPLRYGAGVKGKIVHALRTGLPVVTTSIGAEGIGITSDLDGVVSEGPLDLATAAVALLADPGRCAQLSCAGAELIKNRFSIMNAEEFVTGVFGSP